MSDIEQRLAELERRVSALEGRPMAAGQAPTPAPGAKQRLVSVIVSNKRYDPADYTDGNVHNHIWFDCLYTLAADAKPTRAVKGALVFCDLFGEEFFRLSVTITTPLQPGIALANPGIGFQYNEFIASHTWMLSHDLPDMTIRFDANSAIYADGTTEKFE